VAVIPGFVGLFGDLVFGALFVRWLSDPRRRPAP
jgi:hypothetical protein